MNPGPPTSDSFLRIDAAAAADGRGLEVAPASLLVRFRAEDNFGGLPNAVATLRAIGSPEEVDGHPESGVAQFISRPDCVLVPGFVNAHTHLDLTHIGPQPY